MALPPGFIDELRGRLSLSQIVGRRVSWDLRKSNTAKGDWWAPCPFHQEKSASFHVDDAKGYYYCFGCHAKGDAISFLRESESLGFMEAVERLAAEAGMPMPAQDPAAAARAAANQGLAEAMEAAVQFYRLQLNTARATEARAYLDRRGLAPATRDRFEIGYAPDTRTALLEHMTGKGFSRDKLAEAGLVGVPQDGGSPYDRFRGRITFPIRDPRGRAIAFGARAIAAGQEPKYLNSPDTPLFDKGRSLYNAGPARAAATKAGTVIVTEGYMDVIALAQAGLDHAVAPLGTAVTETQLEMLWKLASEPVVALDGDTAGIGAAHRLIDLALPLLAPGRSLRFALMPAGQDPDDVVRSGGAAAMQALLDRSEPIVGLVWTREIDGHVFDSPERRAGLEKRLGGYLARIAHPGLRNHWKAEFRRRRDLLFAPPPLAARRRDQPRRGAPPGRPIAPGAPSPSTKASLLGRPAGTLPAEARIRESAILWGCLNHPGAALAVEDRLEDLAFRCPDLAQIRDALLFALSEPLDEPGRTAAAVAQRLGRDPLPELAALGHLRANPHLGPAAEPHQAARAIEEELTRHAALAGRAAEILEAVAEPDHLDEAVINRVRAAADAEQSANTRPLEDDATDDASERALFATVITAAEASRSRKPRKH
jgi:DNA primase